MKNRILSHDASRRSFLKRSGALTIGFTLFPVLQADAQQGPANAMKPVTDEAGHRFDSWLRLNRDGSVVFYTGKVELGQGILTAFSQIVGDELDVAMTRLRIVSGDTAQGPNEGVTSGSQSVEVGGRALRTACAKARARLLQAASQKLGAPATALKVADGRISAPDGKTVTYWQLLGEDLETAAPAEAPAKPVAQYQLVGTSVPRRDIPGKVTGAPAYLQDMRLPGMLFARVVRPASPGAKLLSFDEAGVKALPGVVAVLRDGSYLAVAAKREEQAIKAMRALKASAKWEETDSLPPSGMDLVAAMISAMPVQTTVINEKKGETPAGAKTLEALYSRPYQAHASIGPSCSVARFSDGKMEVWSHTQGVFNLRTDLSKVLGLPLQNVIVRHRESAGCYGHNAADDAALDAALLARALPGTPIKLQLMREDEFGWEPFGSAMAMRLRGAVDGSGRIVDWQHEVWSQPHSMRPGDSDGINLLSSWYLAQPFKAASAKNVPPPSGGSDRNAVPLYKFPQQKVVNHLITSAPLRASSLRTLGAYGNVFALESFMDEMAALAGVDPVEFRLRHLEDPRARAVIQAVADKAQWSSQPARGSLQGRGIAFSQYKNQASYVAVIADVAVDRASGDVRVSRLTAAVDAGLVVNPDGLRNQIEGGLIQSASWTLREAIGFDRRRVTTASWADYPALRFPDVPAVDVVLIDRPDRPSLGVGEGAQGPAAAAIGNALANALGKRLRDLPFNAAGVKALIA
ncbi:CO or xanthine dehydrogenase, Mo-binding subunit [Noviherbaspirillum humi]|uniref:CO or xanthine dehydrogenase, Mo-binding subunit n=1 Tax=Noviherbaspirillum humi TaxID=1688639 RepID=A0A239JZQ9_9BURK|nr:molybdopterin cofactor-binding domain-containing protein [Noviherbaspirillum humi]SNT11255.1 CO or xanthine dehydrogenase, Mo-binding subunit [Noviherbaspirillum humi]